MKEVGGGLYSLVRMSAYQCKRERKGMNIKKTRQ